jgi:hypothetical protein
MEETIKIAILSDLHCRPGEGKTPSEVNTFLMSEDPDIAPVHFLKELRLFFIGPIVDATRNNKYSGA